MQELPCVVSKDLADYLAKEDKKEAREERLETLRIQFDKELEDGNPDAVFYFTTTADVDAFLCALMQCLFAPCGDDEECLDAFYNARDLVRRSAERAADEYAEDKLEDFA